MGNDVMEAVLRPGCGSEVHLAGQPPVRLDLLDLVGQFQVQDGPDGAWRAVTLWTIDDPTRANVRNEWLPLPGTGLQVRAQPGMLDYEFLVRALP